MVDKYLSKNAFFIRLDRKIELIYVFSATQIINKMHKYHKSSINFNSLGTKYLFRNISLTVNINTTRPIDTGQ